LVSSSREEYASYKSVKESGYLPTRVKLTRNGETIYKWTVDGDGAVANAQSILNNIEPDIISGVGHNQLTKDPTVIDLVIKYYKNFRDRKSLK